MNKELFLEFRNYINSGNFGSAGALSFEDFCYFLERYNYVSFCFWNFSKKVSRDSHRQTDRIAKKAIRYFGDYFHNLHLPESDFAFRQVQFEGNHYYLHQFFS